MSTRSKTLLASKLQWTFKDTEWIGGQTENYSIPY